MSEDRFLFADGVVRETVDGNVWEYSSTTDLAGDAGAAVFSESYQYRYGLSRTWRGLMPGRRVTWIMLNPSKAGAVAKDPTITRCLRFSRSWPGINAMTVVNLFAFIATDPRHLAAHAADQRTGPDNDAFITSACEQSAFVVAAWGAHPLAVARGREVLGLLTEVTRLNVRCLGVTKDGYPRHPLYVRSETELAVYESEGAAA